METVKVRTLDIGARFTLGEGDATAMAYRVIDKQSDRIAVKSIGDSWPRNGWLNLSPDTAVYPLDS